MEINNIILSCIQSSCRCIIACIIHSVYVGCTTRHELAESQDTERSIPRYCRHIESPLLHLHHCVRIGTTVALRLSARELEGLCLQTKAKDFFFSIASFNILKALKFAYGINVFRRHTVAWFVEALCCKSESHGFY
jgi:hypothetical protein